MSVRNSCTFCGASARMVRVPAFPDAKVSPTFTQSDYFNGGTYSKCLRMKSHWPSRRKSDCYRSDTHPKDSELGRTKQSRNPFTCTEAYQRSSSINSALLLYSESPRHETEFAPDDEKKTSKLNRFPGIRAKLPSIYPVVVGARGSALTKPRETSCRGRHSNLSVKIFQLIRRIRSPTCASLRQTLTLA